MAINARGLWAIAGAAFLAALVYVGSGLSAAIPATADKALAWVAGAADDEGGGSSFFKSANHAEPSGEMERGQIVAKSAH